MEEDILIKREKYFENMKKYTEYSEKYDSRYDKSTGEWIQSKCSDPHCEFCANRPDKAF